MVKPLSARQHELSSGRGWETILPDMGLRHSSSLLAPHTETRPGLTILPATSLMPWKELKCETKLFAHTAPMRQEPSGRPALPAAGSQKCHPESIQGSNSGPPLVLYWPKICPLSTGLCPHFVLPHLLPSEGPSCSGVPHVVPPSVPDTHLPCPSSFVKFCAQAALEPPYLLRVFCFVVIVVVCKSNQ